jgi:hypothetical protein
VANQLLKLGLGFGQPWFSDLTVEMQLPREKGDMMTQNRISIGFALLPRGSLKSIHTTSDQRPPIRHLVVLFSRKKLIAFFIKRLRAI